MESPMVFVLTGYQVSIDLIKQFLLPFATKSNSCYAVNLL